MKKLRTWIAALAMLALGLAAAFLRGKKTARAEDAMASANRQRQADAAAQAIDAQVDQKTDDEVRDSLVARARRHGGL